MLSPSPPPPFFFCQDIHKHYQKPFFGGGGVSSIHILSGHIYYERKKYDLPSLPLQKKSFNSKSKVSRVYIQDKIPIRLYCFIHCMHIVQRDNPCLIPWFLQYVQICTVRLVGIYPHSSDIKPPIQACDSPASLTSTLTGDMPDP